MADARALLRAKRQEVEARITHPYASYNASGQLRCSACGVPIKSATMWEGHVGSKPHRIAVRNMKVIEQEERANEMKRMGKRKAEEEVENEMEVDVQENISGAKKRKTSVELDEALSTTKPTGFPADFFSDPSKAPVLSTADEEDEEEDEVQPSQTTPAVQPNQPKSQVDLEWEELQASLLAPSAVDEEREDERRATFERATVIAEPELLATNAGGFPPEVIGDANGVEEKNEETEEERRRRKEQEERELIMDRIIEEERAQEEADERVELLKARIEVLKKAREARRKAK